MCVCVCVVCVLQTETTCLTHHMTFTCRFFQEINYSTVKSLQACEWQIKRSHSDRVTSETPASVQFFPKVAHTYSETVVRVMLGN